MGGRIATTLWSQVLAARDLTQGFFQESSEHGQHQYSQLKKYLTSAEPQVPHRETASASGLSESAVESAVRHLLAVVEP